MFKKKSTWLHSAILLQWRNDRHLSVPHSSKLNECVDYTKLPTLATLKTDGHYLNGFLWRLEQKSIRLEVRIDFVMPALIYSGKFFIQYMSTLEQSSETKWSLHFFCLPYKVIYISTSMTMLDHKTLDSTNFHFTDKNIWYIIQIYCVPRYLQWRRQTDTHALTLSLQSPEAKTWGIS